MPMLTAHTRRLVVLLAALTALVAAAGAGLVIAPAAHASGAQNRVRGFTPAARTLAPLPAAESACSHQGSIVSSVGIAPGFCVAAEEGSSLLSRLLSEETGAVGPGAGDLAAAQRFAKKVYLPADSPAVANRGLTVQEYVSQFRNASVGSEMPGEFLNQTVEQALRSGNSTVRKLLISGDYAK